jgi:hypothetical protein
MEHREMQGFLRKKERLFFLLSSGLRFFFQKPRRGLTLQGLCGGAELLFLYVSFFSVIILGACFADRHKKKSHFCDFVL